MSTHMKVRFLRHAPPFFPGEISTVPVATALMLKGKGVAELVGEPVAPPIPQVGATDFDPAKSPIDEVRAFLVGSGETIADSATEAQIRKAAGVSLAKKAQ